MKKPRDHARRKHSAQPKKRFQPPLAVKVVHHIVPKSWQKKFSHPQFKARPYYRNVVTGERKGSEGPGDKMATDWANVVFDSKGFPLDQIEDRLGKEETRLMPALVRVISSGRIDAADRRDLALFLAIQVCRYPEDFERRLAGGQLLAIEMLSVRDFDSLADFHAHLHRNPRYASVVLTQAEFDHFRGLPEDRLNGAVDAMLNAHLREEEGLNPNSVIDAAVPLAATLAGFEWRLLQAPRPAFVLSDRPMPTSLADPFALGLSADFALQIDPRSVAAGGTITAVTTTLAEIAAINAEVEGRAVEWVCGPVPF
jgi:hypothetical protein